MPKTREKRGGWLKIAIGVVVVVIASVAVILTGDKKCISAESVSESKKRLPTVVQFTGAKEGDFFESISSDGTIKARYYALVASRIDGMIDDVFVREGDMVRMDETKLFQVDNIKLTQAVELAKQSLVIAKSTLEERKANYAKAEADLDQADKDFARTKSLYEQRVVPLAEYEIDETKVRQLEALLKVSATNIILAEQNVTLAEISLAMAEKDLRDSIMLAPVDGIVSGRFLEPGEWAGRGSGIVRIDETSNLKVVAYLPSQFYPRIHTGSSMAEVSVLGKKIGIFPVTYKAPAIDSALRTFEIWADVPGDGAYSVPGAQCVINIILRRTHGIGVPRDAVQPRDGKHWVFVPDGEIAKMIQVTPGLDTDGWTELIDSPLKSGDKVVTQGQFLLEDGYPIRERAAIGGGN